MADVAYRSVVKIERVRGPMRNAWLPARDEHITFGVHSEVRSRVYGQALYTHTPARVEYRVRIPESFLADDDAIRLQPARQRHCGLGRALFLRQTRGAVCRHHADEIPASAMTAQQLADDGIVLMMVGGVLVAGADAVARDDRIVQ